MLHIHCIQCCQLHINKTKRKNKKRGPFTKPSSVPSLLSLFLTFLLLLSPLLLQILQLALASRNHKKLKIRGIFFFFCQPHSWEAVHRGLKRIMKDGGLKIKFKKDTFKKCTKEINYKILSFSLIGEMTQSVPLFFPSPPHNLCRHHLLWLES